MSISGLLDAPTAARNVLRRSFTVRIADCKSDRWNSRAAWRTLSSVFLFDACGLIGSNNATLILPFAASSALQAFVKFALNDEMGHRTFWQKVVLPVPKSVIRVLESYDLYRMRLGRGHPVQRTRTRRATTTQIGAYERYRTQRRREHNARHRFGERTLVSEGYCPVYGNGEKFG